MAVADVAKVSPNSLILLAGAPYGTRTRVTAVKGRCPGPLDEGRTMKAREKCANQRAGHIKRFGASGKQAWDGHHFPILGIEVHGSFGGSGEPFWSNSMECL